MAKSASSEQVQSDLKETDWGGGVRMLRDQVKAKKDKVSSINGEISAKYDILEKDGINKRGAKMWLALDGMEATERRDVLRTLEKLSAEAGWDTSDDLVDSAEKEDAKDNVVEMPKGKGKAKDPKPVDGNTKIDPQDWKQAVVDRITDESEMGDDDAWALANRIFDDLTSDERKNLTHTTAVQKADEEMEDWTEGAE